MKISKILFLFYIILLPVMNVPELPFIGSKIQYCDVLFVVFLLFFIYEHIKAKDKMSVPFLLPAAFLLFSFFISLVFNGFDSREIIEYAATVYLVALYFSAVLLIKEDEYLCRCIRVWVLVSSVVCVIGILGYIAGLFSGSLNILTPQIQSVDKISSIPHQAQFYLRASSTLKNPNMFAAYFITSITFIFMIIKSRMARAKDYGFYIFVLSLHLFTALLTKSRIFGPVFLLAASSLFILYPGKKYILLKIPALFLACIFLVLSFMTLAVWVFPVEFKPFKINTQKSEYLILSEAALKMWKDHPVVGVGLGRYNYNLVNYVDWDKAKKVLPDPDNIEWKTKDPHSTYLGWASETGILGLFATLLFLWLNIKNAFFKRDARIIALGVIAFLIAGFSVDILTMRHFWFLLGIGAVIFFNRSRCGRL